MAGQPEARERAGEGPRRAGRARRLLAWAALWAAVLVAGLAASRLGPMAAEWLAKGLGVQPAARVYGEHSTGAGCADESLRRAGACGRLDLGCQAAANMFAAGCLAVTGRDEHLCEEVPAPTRVLAGARWERRWCEAAGVAGVACEPIARTVRGYCHRGPPR